MISSSAQMQSYKSHDLDIMMKTSSGDVINLNMSNMTEMNAELNKDEKGANGMFSFTTMQSFNFDISSENGIDEQDKKEIEEFMKIAQPHIDGFMEELEEQKQTTPMNQIAQEISSLFAPLKEKPEDTQNFAKNEIVKLFDNSIKPYEEKENKLEDSITLLNKILDSFKELYKPIYA
ncbi:MAG: hypothetical protein GQ570_10155 [Helicobacteraceae bacterium]|nr:hypothetical protein [Helicobacteraceae bacterium]